LASSAFIPRYWFRQRCQICSEISKCLETSSTVSPSARSFSPSASLRIICSGCGGAASSCAVLLASSWGIGLTQGVDSFNGIWSMLRSAPTPSPGGSFSRPTRSPPPCEVRRRGQITDREPFGRATNRISGRRYGARLELHGRNRAAHDIIRAGFKANREAKRSGARVSIS